MSDKLEEETLGVKELNYKKGYLILFNTVTDIINALSYCQTMAENAVISSKND